MMPKMDGIEAVKIIRGMGYTNTIVALTANALIGRAKMFMEKGFDGFISKPIDSRELNQALNDFIRNKKPPEVVEMARQEMRSNPAVVSHVSESSEKNVFFVRDAENVVKTLESLSDKLNSLNGDDLVAYITAVHGIKNVLLNIGYKELSEKAYELEQAGEGQNYDVMLSETPAFINALKTLSAKHKIENKNKISEISAEDKEYLQEKLLVIKDASTAFDKNTAKNGLDDLRKKEWPDFLNSVFDDIATYLLHSEFKKAAAAAEETAEQYK
jgi:YesN/AraC family two-component response regulator